MTISHVFDDPLFSIVNGLIRLINGENRVEIELYGEPGGCKISIERRMDKQHIVFLEIKEFFESFGDEIKEYNKVLSFEIKEKLLHTLFYYQFKKIQQCLIDTSFLKDREDQFPNEEFKRYEALLNS